MHIVVCMYGLCKPAVYPFLPFHNIMYALTESAQTTASTVDGGDEHVLSHEVSGELVGFVTSEEYVHLRRALPS